MGQVLELTREQAEFLTQRAKVLEYGFKDGQPVVRVEFPDVLDEEITESLLRRIVRRYRRLWGGRGPDNGDS